MKVKIMFKFIKDLFKIKTKEELKTSPESIKTKSYTRIFNIIENLDNGDYFEHFTLHYNSHIYGFKINTNLGKRYVYIKNNDVYKEICFSETFTLEEYYYYNLGRICFLAPDKTLYTIKTTEENNVLDIKIEQPKLDENNEGMSEEEIFLSILEIENYINETIKNEDKLNNQHKENEQKFKERF